MGIFLTMGLGFLFILGFLIVWMWLVSLFANTGDSNKDASIAVVVVIVMIILVIIVFI